MYDSSSSGVNNHTVQCRDLQSSAMLLLQSCRLSQWLTSVGSPSVVDQLNSCLLHRRAQNTSPGRCHLACVTTADTPPPGTNHHPSPRPNTSGIPRGRVSQQRRVHAPPPAPTGNTIPSETRDNPSRRNKTSPPHPPTLSWRK